MKERPINLTADEVRAVLDGRMTQLRRPMSHQPPKWCVRNEVVGSCAHFYDEPWPANALGTRSGGMWTYRSPLGGAGDVLWVREPWGAAGDNPHLGAIFYKSDVAGPGRPRSVPRWRSAAIMPRHFSRLTLEVTAVRVERLQGLTEEDAIACATPLAKIQHARDDAAGPILAGFANAWDQRHGKTAPWATSPWTWVVDFKRVEQATVAA